LSIAPIASAFALTNAEYRGTSASGAASNPGSALTRTNDCVVSGWPAVTIVEMSVANRATRSAISC
jgi:hypothetical protein